MSKVLITGGTGLVGQQLCRLLQEKAHQVSILSRTIQRGIEAPTFLWDVKKNEIDIDAINSVDYIIHLAGANIGEKRWTAARKQQIIDSRVQSAELILRNIHDDNKILKGFISSSATGYYGGISSEKIFTETDNAAQDFLGHTCQVWEDAADAFNKIGIRIVKIRTGVVLTKTGGALAKMSIPIKLGMGSPIGTGQQYMPWIHIDDLCSIYLKAIEDDTMKGVYNAVAPEHINNEDFLRALAKSMNKGFWMPNTPSIVLKTALGEMSTIVLQGSRVSADKIQASGYSFMYSSVDKVLNSLN